MSHSTQLVKAIVLSLGEIEFDKLREQYKVTDEMDSLVAMKAQLCLDITEVLAGAKERLNELVPHAQLYRGVADGNFLTPPD